MSRKVRVCTNVEVNTARLIKLYRSEIGHQKLDRLVDKYLSKVLTKELKSRGLKLSIEPDSSVCPKCSKGLLVQRKGSKGEFLGCSTFPKCNYTK